MGRLRGQVAQVLSIVLAVLFCSIWASAQTQCPSPEFTTSGNFGVGEGARFATIADFNRDGIPDIAVANSESNSISILLGQGNGTAAAPLNITLSSSPRFIVTGDFDGDGFLDLAVASSTSDRISLLAGRGNGSFGAARAIGAGGIVTAIVAGDFNRDGETDLAAANEFNNSVSVMFGRGNFSFRRPLAFELGVSPSFLTSGDFNRDGFIDLAVSSEANGNLFILLGHPNGTFGNTINLGLSANLRTIALADFNGDNFVDLAVVSPTSNRVFVLLSRGDGTCSAPIGLEAGSAPSSVAVGDFNADGFFDLAVANSGSGNVSIMFGRGDGTFCPATNFATNGPPSSIVVGDFDGDGRTDLLTVNSGGSVTVILNTARCSSMRISANSSLDARVGENFATTLSVTGGNAPYSFSVVGGLPAGLTLSGLGFLSGTPTVEGNFTIRVRVQDVAGCDVTQNINVRVGTGSGQGGCPGITVSAPSLAELTVGSSVNAGFSAAGGSGSFTFTSLGRLPGGLTLNADGTITGTVTEIGDFSFNVRATDSAGCNSALLRVTMKVKCPTLSITVPDLSSIALGGSIDATFTASGSNGTVTFSAIGLPAGMTLTAEGRLTGTLNAAGGVNFTVRATDQFGCASASVPVNISVGCPNINVTMPSLSGVTAGTDLSLSFGSSGATGSVTFSAIGLPAGLSLSSTGTLSGRFASTGSFSFDVRATDAVTGCASANTTVTINVTCPSINIAMPDLSGITAGGNVNASINATGGSGNFNFSASGLPAGLTIDANGRLQGNFNVSGEVSFSVTATDDLTGCTATLPVTVNIGCPNINANMTGAAGLTINDTINARVNANGGSGNFTFELVGGAGSGLPAGVSLSANGEITGTIGGVGRFFFTVRVTDTITGCSVDVPFELPVGCDSLNLNRGTLASLVGFGADLNGMALSASGSGSLNFELIGGGLPAGVTLNANGTFSGNAGGVGNFFFNVRVTDANGCFGEAELNIIVDCPNITISGPTTINATAGSAIAANAFTVNGASTALVNLNAQGTMPTGVTFDSTTGAFVGIPTQTGTFTVNLSATDDNNCGSKTAFTVTIVVE